MGTETELAGYFGYGSLVNRRTLTTDFVSVHRASLSGWRRHWQSRGTDRVPATGEEIALLSVHRHADTVIDGMLVIDRKAHLHEVDLREARYDRVPCALEELRLHEEAVRPDETHVYVGHKARETAEIPKLLQSYLDTVMSGFLNEFGEAGLAHFLETTIGFERPILLDRREPIYSRSMVINGMTARRFDDMLAERGVIFP